MTKIMRLNKFLLLFLWLLALESNASDFLWIGNANAKFSDATSWSSLSAKRVPQVNDNIIFKRGQRKITVLLDESISINNLIIEKGCDITFISPSKTSISITGSFNSASRLKFKGQVDFRFLTGFENCFLLASGTQFTGDLFFSGSKELKVEGDLQTSNNIILENQKLNFNSNFIWCKDFKFSGTKSNQTVFNKALIIADNFIGDQEKLLTPPLEITSLSKGDPVIGTRVLCGAPIPFDITAVVTTDYNGYDVSCNDSSDATICVNVVGGVGPFNYSWVAGPTTSCYTNVDAGTYLVVVFDMGQGGFSCFTSVTVNEPPPITLLSWTGTNPTCFGFCDGTASPFIIGGVPPFNYLWSSGETTPNSVALCNGLNTVEVTDANGCIFDTAFFILIPTAVLPNATGSSVSCFGDCDGTAFSVPSGGNGAPYTFLWSTGSVNDSVNSLCPGPVSVTVTDFMGCTGNQTVTITEPLSIAVTLVSITNLVCATVCTGSITITSSNGTLPHSYQWFNAGTGLPIPLATGATVSGLCAGTYFVVVTDAAGCTFQSINFTVTSPPPITISTSATNPTCNGACNGILSAVTGGGTGALSVTWFNAFTGTPIGSGNPLGGVCAGTYFAQVTDANGCISFSTPPIVVTEPPALVLTVTDTDILCNSSCTGTATAVVSGGTGALTVSWQNSPSGTSAGSGNPLINMCNGNYTATVTDANGCTSVSTVFAITEPPPLVIDSQGNTDITCNGACDGSAFFNVSGGTGTITIVWFQNPGAVPIGQTGTTATNLCPGTYFAIATDANGCTIQSANQVLTQPAPLTITVTPTSSDCGTLCNGTASAVVSGGTGVYTFSWVNATTGIPTGITTNPATGLCAGNYYLVVTDASLCDDTSAIFTITSTVIVTGSIVGTDITCNGTCNGFADLTPAGGILPYTYDWFDQATGLPIGQSTEDANGLCPGTFFVIATDASACSSVPILVTINEPTAITTTVVGVNALCSGVCSGQITATVSGGTPGYTLSWINATTGVPIGQTGLVATGLCAGDYFLQVTDANGCIVNTSTVTITDPTSITATVVTTDASCFGVCDGTASLTISGGLAPYTVSWTTSANTSANELGICAGNFAYSVTDANGCIIGPFNFTITEPSNITATITNGTASCNGLCNGVVSVNVSGGTGPFTYAWNDPVLQTTPVAIGLCDGNFDVTITDAAGCSFGPFTATVTEPTALSVSVTSVDANCAGGCNGTATVTILGGTSPSTISWNDPLSQTTPTAIGLCAGAYIVTVTDGNGCTTTGNAIINTSNIPTIALSQTNVSCNGACDGTATAVLGGGAPPLTILWSTGATALSISSLCIGTYSATVTDLSGCTANASITITEQPVITATSTTTITACSVCSATATITPSGGTGGYTYQWSVSAGSQTTQTATALCAGIHTVIVTDNSGCSQTFTVAITNSGSEVITVDSTNVTCNALCDGSTTVSFICSDPPCTILWNDPSAQSTNTATALCAGTFGVTVTNNSGCISAATIEVDEPLPILPNVIGTDVLCNGVCTGTAVSTPTGGNGVYTYLWNDPAAQTASTAFNLCTGIVMVTVTDSIGCTGTASVTINEPSAITFSTSSSDVNCFGQCDGIGTVFPSGGISPYTFQWDDPANQTSQSATALCAGSVNVTVFDANGCTVGPQSITINEPSLGVVSISSTSPACNGDCNGSASANVNGGTAPYTFSWDDPLAQTTQTATNLCAGTYTVVVSDANGCVVGSATVTLTTPLALSINILATNVTCNGLCDGIANSNISGGTAPYSALWNDPAGQVTAIASALCPGTYTVIVTDAAGCLGSGTQTITEPAAIASGLDVTDVLCNGDCNGTATVVPSGGTGAISVLWTPGSQTTNSITNQCAGNYSVSLIDAAGCSSITNFTINEPAIFSVLTGSSPALCGICDGSASVSPVGGTPPYSTLWDASAANQTTLVALNLCANIYSVTITDSEGCSITTNVGVSNFDGEVVTISSTNASCPDICNGTATANTACVDGPCTFAWFDVPTGSNLGITTSTINSLCPGDYISRVINASNCTTLVTFNIDAPDTIDVTPTITNLSCNSVCNGAITVIATGGTGALSFQWDAAAGGGTTNAVTNLCAGNYDLIVTDVNGCDDTVVLSVSEPLPITIIVNPLSALCTGTCTGVATALVSGGTPGYSFLWNDPSAQTGSSASALCGGNYTVTVTDANGCTNTSLPASIVDPVLMTASVSNTDPTCISSCDGTATVTVTGGTAPTSIQWTDPASQTTITALNLCSGVFDVTVTDANNCNVGPLSVTITDPLPITATTTIVDVLCNGLCNGSITILAAGGSGGYIYSINGGTSFQGSNVFTNLCPGAYNLIIQDASGCNSSTVSVNVNEPTLVDATTSSLDAGCTVSNGAATVFPFGGTPGYTIVWADNLLVPIGQITPTAINLSAGIYIATITDANGCQIQQSVTVSNIIAPSATGVFTSPTCNGDCNGAIDITTTGGTAPYSYVWFPNAQTTEDITNVCAGTLTVQITDVFGCIGFTALTLTEPPAFNSNVTVTEPTCGLCDGQATTIVSGGTGALSIVWSNLDIGSTATNLCGGAFSYLVTDANGCSNQFNVLVNNSTGPTPVVNVTNPTCSNSCSGTATVSAIGGTLPYSFLWVNDGSTALTQNNLCAGNLIVQVQDSLGCIGIANVTITSSPPISDSMVVSPAVCGVCDGTAVIFTSGLTPFTFQWNAAAGGATTPAATSLCMGLYSVVITDAAGCTDTAIAIVPNINAPTVSVITTGITCSGVCDATATASGVGGTAPLTFNWFDISGSSIGINSSTINSLCGGDYFVQVTDAAGCGSFMNFNIDEPDSLVASINFTLNELCFNTCDGIMSAMPINGTLPFTYAWAPPAGLTTSTASNLCDGIYSVLITDANGCSISLTDTIAEPPVILMTLDTTSASCSSTPDGSIDATVTGGAGGFTYSWTGPGGYTANTEDISGLFFGTYILTATDANGCSSTDSIFLDAILMAIADAGNDTVICGSATGIVLIGNGSVGANYSWTDTLGNVLSPSNVLNVAVTGTTQTFIFVVNNSGCIGTDTVDVTINPLPLADAGPDVEILLGESTGIGGNPTASAGSSVLWSPVTFLDNSTALNPTASPDTSTMYIVNVTDVNGCTNADTMLVVVFPNIIFPNGFSPNGDGPNDTWILDFIEFFPDCEVSVFNRWGQPVFYSKGYDIPWDGTFDGNPVTVGTYYYVILLNHPLFPDAFTGPLTILR
jgi:gliding motility-associated-like protein